CRYCFPSGWLFFFFSSRRRHTRSLRDWSSDVCSSDFIICGKTGSGKGLLLAAILGEADVISGAIFVPRGRRTSTRQLSNEGWVRSEERRVGKEWRGRRRRKK